MTPEQSFILSLLSPMKTFPMVIPGHLRTRIDRYRILRARSEALNTSDIVRQALTLFAYSYFESDGHPSRRVVFVFAGEIADALLDGNGKSANIKLPPVVIERIERLADVLNQTKSDIARGAIVWFLDQMEAEQ